MLKWSDIEKDIMKLRPEARQRVTKEFDKLSEGCETTADFMNKLGANGLLWVPPEIVHGALKLRYNRYLHLHNGDRYIISSTPDGDDVYGASCNELAKHLEAVRDEFEDSTKWEAFIHFSHVMCAAAGYREFRKLIHRCSDIIPNLINTEVDVYGFVRAGIVSQPYTSLAVHATRNNAHVANVFVSASAVCIKTSSSGPHLIPLPQCDIPYTRKVLQYCATMYLLGMVGLAWTNDQSFTIDRNMYMLPIRPLEGATVVESPDDIYKFFFNG